MKKSLFILSLIISCYIQAQNAEQKGLQTINKSQAEAVIEFLASDELEGREAGTPSGKVAARFISSFLKMTGIEPYLDSYYQPFEAVVKEKRLYLNNVIGKIEGKRKDEFVIVGAHYDHLGIDTTLVGDQIYNGADDNASGVSAVLQIAKAFIATGEQPERTVLFALWDGEEKKLLGSNYFVETFPGISQIKGYLNFDMIGRNQDESNPTHVVFFYTQEFPNYQEWLHTDIQKYELQITPSYKPCDNKLGGSDNVSFGRRDIPIMWFHTDGHPDYHKPTDHSDKLNWNKLVDITKASFLLMWKWANE